MNRSFVIGFALMCAVISFAAPASPAANRAAEKVHVGLNDGKEWKEGFVSTDTASTSFIEYVPKGEAPSAASEKVTVQMFSALRPGVTPTTYTNGLKVSTLKRNPNAVWNIIRSGDDVMYEFEFSGDKGSGQHEIGRVISKNGKFYIVSYLSIKGPLAADKREMWIKLLDLVTFAE
jgi:hypothetical protein